MAKTVAFSQDVGQIILSRLDELEARMVELTEKLEGAPTYGSDEWWEWSDKKAMEDYKAGRYTEIRNKKELKKFLDSLK